MEANSFFFILCDQGGKKFLRGGSFLAEYVKSLTEEKYTSITSFEYANRESYEIWKIRDGEDRNAFGGE